MKSSRCLARCTLLLGVTVAASLSLECQVPARSRAERAADEGYRDFLAAVRNAAWSREIILHDDMRLYDFPAELLSYPLQFSSGNVRAVDLQLTELRDGRLVPIRFQLTDAKQQNSGLCSATLNFRTDLAKGDHRRFYLTAGLHYPLPPLPDPSAVALDAHGDTGVFHGNCLRLRVPIGVRTFDPRAELATLPAPILAIARTDGGWRGAGSFIAPKTLTVSRLAGETEVTGPLIARHRVTYTFSNGRTYSVRLTVRHDDPFVTIDESLGGLEPTDEAYFKFSFSPGLDPSQRQVAGNGGYDAYSGLYSKNASRDGQLPLQLGLNTPNSLGVMRACAFWNANGADALLLAVNRPRDWKTAERHVWYNAAGPGNLCFFDRGGEKFLQTRLEGRQRHWALALIPRPAADRDGRLTDRFGAGPEVRLWQRLTDFSLDTLKNHVFDWDEDLTARPAPDPDTSITFQQWMESEGAPLSKGAQFISRIPEVYWDRSGEVSPVSFRNMPRLFATYAASRATWTPQQRHQARAVLLFMTYSAEDDANLPHHSMLAGHPNFVMDVKQVLPLACATFPNHPDAKQWRDSFMGFFDEFLDVYQRKPDPTHNAAGGRWTENIAAYSGTALAAVLNSHEALQRYDNTNLLADPRVQAWVRWYRDTMMSPHEGQRLVPPEGAHAYAFEPQINNYWPVLSRISDLMSDSSPQLSAEMAWIRSNGRMGTRPNLQSTLIRDYGPVMRYDFGGPNEAYLHLTQVSGRWNYRWGNGSDALYYGARNRVWSYNGPEDAGDNFSIGNLCSFSIAGQGLGRHATDQILYDFDFAQFYRVLADPAIAAKTGYRSRGLMMLRNDYLVIHDDADKDVQGQFAWANATDLPEIYQLKPGVPYVAETCQPSIDREIRAKEISVRRYSGRGDFLTVVSPTPVQAQSTAFGAQVNGDYVFLSREPQLCSDSNMHFRGTAGYARPNQLALFAGDEIGLNAFTLRRTGGDFGVSVSLEGRTITGSIAGREGGHVVISLPPGFNAVRGHAWYRGRPITLRIAESAVELRLDIAQADGNQPFFIGFE